MSNVTISQIAAAMRTIVLTLDGESYQTDMVDTTHIYPAYSMMLNVDDDASYPKAVVALDGGSPKQSINHGSEKRVTFDLIFLVKQIGENDDTPTTKSLRLVEDVERLLHDNSTLLDLADNVELLEWSTDSTFAHPEGCVWFKIAVEYRTRH